MSGKFVTLRAEIRAIVEEAQRAGRPLTLGLIWGLLSRDVREHAFRSALSNMVGRGELVLSDHCYLPGSTPIRADEDARGARPSRPLMGNREALRLKRARRDAQAWLREGRAAA